MTPSQALELVRERRVLPFASFVEAVAGEPVKGSWWGHAKGHEIFNLAGHVSKECVFVRLVGRKETLLHESLYPAFARVVLDEAWRAPRVRGLSREAAAILRLVEGGTTRMDEIAKKRKKKASALRKPRHELQEALLVHSTEIHTDRGHHVAVLVPWSDWARPVQKAARKLTLDAALAELRAACGAGPTALD
ncbi:MAG TPA: RNA methyltransferase [Planctomycetota bacterium]|nr:RNA methyltransferase [Planctomycetota bacterium]